jgi:hypothetical protein
VVLVGEVKGIEAVKLSMRRKRTYIAVVLSTPVCVLAPDHLAWYWSVPVVMVLFVATTIVVQTAVQAEQNKES